jgi:hypothetical protein
MIVLYGKEQTMKNLRLGYVFVVVCFMGMVSYGKNGEETRQESGQLNVLTKKAIRGCF